MSNATNNNEKIKSSVNSRQELIVHYLEQADEALVSAQLWFRARKPNSYINRLLFANIYAMLAMLLADGLNPRCRRDVARWFNDKFTQRGRIPEEINTTFETITKHCKSLNGDFVDMTREQPNEVETWLGETRAFVNYAKEATSHV